MPYARVKWWVIALGMVFTLLTITLANAKGGGMASTQAATAAPTADSAPTTATGGDVPLGSSVRGQIDDRVYSQAWHFRGDFGDVLDIRMVRQTGNLNPVLALVSPIGDVIAASAPLDGGLDASILGYQLPFTGGYTIIARRDGNNRGAAGDTAGNYELSVSLRGANTAALNTIIIPSTPVQGRLNDNAPVALYRMENGGALALWLDLGSLHRLARVRILNTMGTVLSSRSGMSPLNVPVQLPDKGPFLVEVTSLDYDNAPFADFSLTVFRLSANMASLMANWPGEPQPLHYGEQRQSTVSSVAGPDEYFFRGHAGDMVSLSINPDLSATDTSVRVSGPGDAVLFEGPLGRALQHVYSLTDSGIYEIVILPTGLGAQPGGTQGQPTAPAVSVPYTIDLERTGANFNSFGVIDLAPDRGPLALDAPTNGTLKAGDSDAWWLDATAGQVISLTLAATSANTPLGLALKRPDGSSVDVQITERLQGAVIQQALLNETGRYRVVVFDSQGKNGGQYTLRYEDASGGILQPGQRVKGLATPANGYSSWSLDAGAGSLINLRLDSLSASNWSPTLSILDPNGQILATSDTSQDAQAAQNAQPAQPAPVQLVGVMAPLTGRYTVVVGGQVQRSLASYDLLANMQMPFGTNASGPIRVSSTLPPLPRYATMPSGGPVHVAISSLLDPMTGADKQALDKAAPINNGTTVRGEISPGAFSQVWRFDVVLNQTISLTATSLAGSTGPDLALVDSGGNVIHEQLHANDSTTVLAYRTSQNATYRAVVRMGMRGGRYLLALNTVEGSSQALQVTAGAPMLYGQTIPGEIPPGNTTNLDQYAFLGAAGDTVSIRLMRAIGDLVPALHLLGPTGTEVASDANPGSATTAQISSFRLLANGMYTIVAQRSASGLNSSGRYFLSLGVESGFRVGSRGGGIITSGASVDGLLSGPNNQDTWLFQGHAGELVSFRLTGVSDPMPAPLGLRLQDTAGTTFAAQDAVLTQGAVRLSEIILPADGIYQLQVVGGGTAAGLYSLAWTQDQKHTAVGPLRYDETVGGVFSTNHNADSWVFSGTAGDVVSIALEYERGDHFTGGLQVRSENGLALATIADSGNGAGARADNLLLPFSGSYTVVAANPTPGFKGAGVYSLSVVLRDSKARSSGGLLRYGQQATGDLYVDDPTDTWVFAAHAGDVVKLSAQAQDQFLKPSLDLKTPAGVVLASAQADSADRTGQVKLNDYPITADGVYVVTIGGGSGKTTGSYRLSLDYTPPPLPPNAELNYGDTKEGLIADDRPQQNFVFSGRLGDTITAKVTRESGAVLAATISVKTADGQLLVRADADGTDTATIKAFMLPATGQYTLAVGRYLDDQGKTSGRFTVNVVGTPEDRPIKNTVNYGQQVLGRLSDQTPLDRINFTGKAGDVIAVTSHATSGDLDTTLTLEDSTGKVLAANDDANGSDAAISGVLLTNDGLYTVTISRAGTRTVGGTGNYELFINRIYQTNATAAPQALIGYGQRVVSSVDPSTTEARYTFSGDQGDEVSVQLVHQTDDAPPLLTIQDPAGSVLAQGKLTVGQTTIDDYQLPVAGLYTISVRRTLDARQTFSPFALTLNLLSSQGGSGGAGAGTSAAVGSASGGVIRLSESVSGEFTGGQNAHYWLFEARAGQIITVNLLGLTNNLVPTAILIGPGGQALAASVPSAAAGLVNGAAGQTQFTLPFDGVYSLLILPATQTQGGQYRLTVQPNNTTSPVPVALSAGQTVNGTINAEQPEQRWAISGQAGQTITARMIVTAGTLIPRLQLISASGQIVAESHVEQSAAARSSNLLATSLPAPGTYTLLASAADVNSGGNGDASSGAGTYRLSLETGALSVQASAAAPITFGQSVHKAIQQGSTDYWSFNAAAGDAITASVIADNGKAPGLILQDAGGQVLAQAPASDALEQDIPGVALTAAGRYVLALPAPSTTAYTVIVQRRQSLIADGINPRPMIVGQPLDGALTADNSVNYWVFSAKAGDAVEIDATRLNGEFRPDYALFSPTSGFIAGAIADPVSGAAKIGPLRVAQDGKYLLVATRWLGSASKTAGRYSLTLTNPTGAPIVGGGLIQQYGNTVIGTVAVAGDHDVWTFNGQAGEVINIRMARTAGMLIPSLKLSRGDGREIASVNADKDQALITRVILATSGQYSITATRADDKSAGTYQLAVERIQTALQASMAHAEGIAFGEDHPGELTTDVPARAYVFFGKAGERITVEVAPASGSALDPYVVILAPDGATLAADDNSGGDKSARIGSLLLPSDGFYGIVVTGSPVQQQNQAGTQFGTFSVMLTRDQPGAAYQGNVAVGGTMTGNLLPEQPVQEWTFEAGAGQTIAASISSPSTLFDVVLSITTQDGKLLAQSSPTSGGAVSIEAPLPGPGAYAVLVSSNSRGAAGQYQLGVSYALAPSGGGALVSGEMVQGTISDADFTDAWRVNLSANAALTLDVARQSGNLELALALYGPDGTAVALPTDGTTGTSTLHIDGQHVGAAGTYILVVSRAGAATGHTAGVYQLQLTAE